MTSEKLIEALEDNNFEVRSYSGRGMYGKSCVAVYDASEWEVAKLLFHDVYEEEFKQLAAPHTDSMGLGVVLYWPSMKWPEGKKSSDEEDED